MSVGEKHDIGKPMIELIDPSFLLVLGDVLSYGAAKYEPENWRKGIPAGRLYGALQRHLIAFQNGEDMDQESGLPHLGHAACELMFLYWTVANLPDLDDRWSTRNRKEKEEWLKKRLLSQNPAGLGSCSDSTS